jgi:light-regulated signal transduction histidine kinase (bacteriophytochrome)
MFNALFKLRSSITSQILSETSGKQKTNHASQNQLSYLRNFAKILNYTLASKFKAEQRNAFDQIAKTKSRHLRVKRNSQNRSKTGTFTDQLQNNVADAAKNNKEVLKPLVKHESSKYLR